jgi:hypothetical protein
MRRREDLWFRCRCEIWIAIWISKFLIDCCPVRNLIYIGLSALAGIVNNITARRYKKTIHEGPKDLIRCPISIFQRLCKNAINILPSLRRNLLVRRCVCPSIPQFLITNTPVKLTYLPTVFIFTTALFLSGYVLQQQTVRDLRAAIKPQLVRPNPGPDLYLPPQFRDAEYWEERGVVDAIQVVEPERDGEGRGESDSAEGENIEGGEAGEDDMIGATRWQKAAARKKKSMEELALQEVQKVIVEEGAEGEEVEVVPKLPEKPISRAERRRRIKEQILAEGEGEGFKGYRRRMW